MTYASRTATVILTGLLAIASTCGRAAGQGGGHGGSGGGHGFGGHAGHSAGRSSSAHSSGHSIGHSIGHSFAHIFGHHGQGASSVALIKAPAKPWSVTPSPISVPQALRPQPRNPFIFRHRNGFFPRRRTSGFAGCPYGWFDFHFRFDDNWNCPSDAFFFDPFFSGWSSGPILYGSPFGSTTWFESGTATGSTVQSPAEPSPAYPTTNSDATNETPQHSSGTTMSSPNGMKAKAGRPITLLQLRDGSMYGLTDYWAKDGELHYTTTYGGQDSVPFERIDLEKTLQLDADRGVPFVLPNLVSLFTRPTSRPHLTLSAGIVSELPTNSESGVDNCPVSRQLFSQPDNATVAPPLINR